MNGRRLDGKVAIVSGAGSRGLLLGMCRATAILFSREGAKVFLVDWDRKSAEETKAIIQSEGGKSVVWKSDVTKDEACKAMAEAMDCFGVTVNKPGELEGALDQALNAGKPAVVDVKTNVEGIADRAWMPQ